MPAKMSHVNPAVVAWAIRESGYSNAELAKSLKIDAGLVDSWTAGDALLTASQLTALANALKRPRTLFYLSAPPDAGSLPAHLRTAQGESQRALLPSERLVIRRAMRRQAFIADVRENAEPVEFPELTRQVTPIQAGAMLRDWSDVSISNQLAWRSDSEGLRSWIGAAESAGIVPMQLSMGRDGMRGFALPDDLAPIAAMNTAEAPAARSFTLWHEIAHLVLGEQRSCLSASPGAAHVERWCDRTANAVLMPRKDLFEYAEAMPPDAAQIEKAKSVASSFRVSIRAATMALIDAALLPAAAYREIDQTLATDQAKRGGGGKGRKRYETRIAEIGNRASKEIADALAERRVLQVHARRALDVDGYDLRRMAEAVSARS